MPIYVYRCQDCLNVHEAFIRGSRPEPQECPGCGQQALKRIPAAIAALPKSGATPAACDLPSGMCGMGACGGGACAYPG